jgi:hypothetical protein
MMAFRYPNNYSFAILRQGNEGRRSLDPNTDNLRGLYINPRLQSLILDVEDEVGGTGPRPRARNSRFPTPAPDLFSPISRAGTRKQRDRTPRVLDLSPHGSRGVDEYSRRLARTELGRERNGVLPFSLAVNELQRQLVEAMDFYVDLNTKYEKDIERIKKYATKEVLEKIWTLKVTRSKDPGTMAHDQYHDQNRDNLFAECEDQFVIRKRTLSHALDGAISSSLRGSHDDPNGARHQSMIRLIDKIRMANQQLLPLFDTAWKRPELCKDLVTELKMLAGLIKSGKGNIENGLANGGTSNADGDYTAFDTSYPDVEGRASTNTDWQGNSEW